MTPIVMRFSHNAMEICKEPVSDQWRRLKLHLTHWPACGHENLLRTSERTLKHQTCMI